MLEKSTVTDSTVTNKKAHPQGADLKTQFEDNTEKLKSQFLLSDKAKRKQLILRTLGNRELTAREIAYRLGLRERNAVHPRLTELEKDGRVEKCGKKIDRITKTTVSVYRRV